MTNSFAEQTIVCNLCNNLMMKNTAKEGPEGILCSRCHPYVTGYIALPRFGDIGFEIATKLKRCVECNKVFNLADPTDSEMYAYGHDCEAK
jgi:phage FluMu protein Com